MPESGPFRYIRKTDTKQPFQNELYELNHVDLLFAYSKNSGKTHVFVYDSEGIVIGFIAFQDSGTHFHIDLVETNRIPESKTIRPGSKLILYLESLSRLLGYRKITLLSLPSPDLVSYYKQLGFQDTGIFEYDANYKMSLRGMQKIIS